MLTALDAERIPAATTVREAAAAPAASRRWIYLDVLRAVAILLVLGAHTPFRLPPETLFYPLFALWKRIGWAGVDLFFVLSGFLIGGLLFAEHRRRGAICYRRFFLRRFFKIWPAYLVFLAATFAWDVREGPGSLSRNVGRSAKAMWPYLVHAQNYYAPLVERIGHAWSLAVEEHFYLLLPLLLAGMSWWAARRQRIAIARADAAGNQTPSPFGAMPWVCLGLAVLCLGLRAIGWRTRTEGEFDPFVHHWPTHARIDSLFVGVALAYAVNFAPHRIEALRRRWWLVAVLSIACFAPIARAEFDSALICTIGYTLLAAGSAGLVLLAWWASEGHATGSGRTHAPSGLPTRALARVGSYSYSIYLWHMPFTVPVVIRLQNHLGLWQSPLHYALMMAIYIAASVGLGAVMYHAVELRALALRERWFSAQPQPKQAPARHTAQAEPGESDAGHEPMDGSALGPAGEFQPAM
jgi:peptidoglycan/LPS O-acetylase OafA/YrhL